MEDLVSLNGRSKSSGRTPSAQAPSPATICAIPDNPLEDPGILSFNKVYLLLNFLHRFAGN